MCPGLLLVQSRGHPMQRRNGRRADHRRDRRDALGQQITHPMRQHGAVGHARNVNPNRVRAVIAYQRVYERCDEAHVVNMLLLGIATTAVTCMTFRALPPPPWSAITSAST